MPRAPAGITNGNVPTVPAVAETGMSVDVVLLLALLSRNTSDPALCASASVFRAGVVDPAIAVVICLFSA
jgi:hypothetical protein